MKIISILTLVLFAFNTLLTAQQKTEPVAAWIIALNNKVEIQPGTKGKWYKAIVGMAIKPQDSIKTADNSWVNIAYENGSIVRVMPNSTIEISKLVFDNEKKTIRTETKIPLMGKIIGIFRKLKKDENSYDIYTPATVVGVRGTDIMVAVTDKDTSYVAVFEGELIVKDFVTERGISTEGNEMLLDFLREAVVGKNQVIEYKKDKGLSKPKDMGKLYNEEKKTAKQLKEEAKTLSDKISKENPENRWFTATKIREHIIKK